MSLASLRESLGYAQKDFAELIGVPTSTYNQYEKGNRAIPAEIATKICSVLNVNEEDIFLAKSFTMCETHVLKNEEV